MRTRAPTHRGATMRGVTILGAAIGALAIAAAAFAMSSANFRIPWDAISAGGSTRTAADYRVRDTLGQAAIGVAEAAAYRVKAGYWYGMAAGLPAGGTVSGQVDLQGRANDSCALVRLDSIYSTTTATDGTFAIAGVASGSYTATVTMSGYLRGERAIAVGAGGATLPYLRLLGGNTDNDSDVGIFDLTRVGVNFGQTVPPADPAADINGDGVVNILDLVLAGANFNKLAPSPW